VHKNVTGQTFDGAGMLLPKEASSLEERTSSGSSIAAALLISKMAGPTVFKIG